MYHDYLTILILREKKNYFSVLSFQTKDDFEYQ